MKWIKYEKTYRMPIRSWCENCEEGAVNQAVNLANHPALTHHVALMPDAHVGYGMPIGGVIAVKNAVIPAAVGVDIGCGMIAAETNVPAENFADMTLRREFQNKLKKRIPVGEGVSHKEQQEWNGFEDYLAENGNVADWCNSLDRKNLGTLGGGNHFIELQKSDDGKIWLMIHSGSRNLGYRIEEHYHKLAIRLNEIYHVALPDKHLAFLPIEENAGRDYFRDMNFALKYAAENRRRMMNAMKETFLEFAPGAEFVRTLDVHHNYATLEKHFDDKVYIHRKGATSAKKDELGIIPGSMGTSSYIVKGLGNPDSFMSCSHGAGRLMSRTVASMTLTEEACNAAMEGIVCEKWKKSHSGRAKGSLDLSEAPQAYKQIDEVIAAEADLIEPLVKLSPLACLKG